MILALINSKGGVGKTTIAMGLAEHLGATGRKVLLVDADPQASATDRYRRIASRGYQLPYDIDVSDELSQLLAAAKQRKGRIDEEALELEAVGMIDKRVRRTLRRAPSYDHVILDGPPGLAKLRQTLVGAADFVLMPTLPDAMSSRAAEAIIRNIRDTAAAGKKIEAALLLNRAAAREKATQLAPNIATQHGLALLETQIPNAAVTNKADMYSLPLQEMGEEGRALLTAFAAAETEIEMER